MLARWKLIVKKFGPDERGSVVTMFGMMAFSLVLMAGIAVDYSRMNDMRSRILSAVDTASLAAGRALLDGQLSDEEVKALAATYFRQNVKSATAMGIVGAPEIGINRETGTVDINVQSKINMTLTRVTGIETVNLPVSSSAIYKQRNIEVGMALDITGSMDETVGGRRKIDALKDAFAEFTDRLIPEHKPESQKVRIAIAPYASGINLGSYAAAASNTRSTDDCVTERANTTASDADGAFFVKEDGQNDIDNSDGSTPKNAYTCPNASIVPLTDDKDALVRAVDSFRANGWTAGHLGVQWAWNLISDNWAGTFSGDRAPDPYADVEKDKLIKAVVLMTDGSFNTAYHGSRANNGNWSKTQAIALCNAMKAHGKDVVVFSVAFDAPRDAQETLKACATEGDGYYANASSPEELEQAFQRFAGKLTELRIAR